MRRSSGGSGCRKPAPRPPGSARPGRSYTRCPRCTSRPTRATGFREPGFSKERRLEPHITTGLLTGQDGFPLMVSAFEDDKGETKTMLPVIEKFMAARRLPDVTVVADAGMTSDANRTAIKAAGLSAAYAAPGVGTISEVMITVDELPAYQDAAEQRLLSVRVRPPIQASTATP